MTETHIEWLKRWREFWNRRYASAMAEHDYQKADLAYRLRWFLDREISAEKGETASRMSLS
jgi:hypothetical protein